MRTATDPESYDEESDVIENNVFEERDPDFIEERFRVDRRKLEQMLQAAEDGYGESGEEFFRKIMDETSTTITWPSKLKIGAKSKKDPHIKICGLPESVKIAKDRVMAVLDTKSNRVTLKMDVSHTDHSHIIGKGGYNIKKVMQDTGCHIHFPDSNRGSSTEKSNQVSIAGQPLGVEAARKQIRDMLPLVLMFELPLTTRGPVDSNSSIIQHIAQTTNVNITFKHRPRGTTQTVIVRGSQQCVSGIKEAVSRLVEYFTGSIATQVVFNMQIDVAPQHHLFIIGRSGSNIKHITNQTGAHVGFPDQNSSLRRGVVFLSGSIDAVICARALLLDCLPLVLMFDLREEDGDVDSARLNKIMEDYNVFVSVKPKPKQPSKSVIIKSGERNAKNIYLARMEILGFDRNQNRASPSSYTSTIISSPSSDRSFYSSDRYNSCSPTSSPTYSANCNGNISPIFQGSTTSWNSHSSQSVRHLSSPELPNFSATPFTFAQSSPPPPPPPGLGPPTSLQTAVTSSPGFVGDFPISHSTSFASLESLTEITTTAAPPLNKAPSPIVHIVPTPIGRHSPITPPGFSGRSPIMDKSSSGSISPRSPTAASPPMLDDGFLTLENDGEGRAAVFSRTSSGSSSSGLPDHQTVEIISGTKNVSLHTTTSNSNDDDDYSLSSSLRSALFKKLLLDQHTIPPIDEYERKKELASKAMQKKVQFPEVRVPTDTWSGLGFSKSMPASAIRQALEKSRIKGIMPPYNGPVNGTLPENALPMIENRESRSNSSPYETTSYQDRSDTFSPTVGERRNSYPCSPIPSSSELENLLDQLGLMKYHSIFHEQEVDWQTFMTLTDDDLKELGVKTFGARRKLLIAIADLRKNSRNTSPPSLSPTNTPPQDSPSNNPLPFPRRLQMDTASHSGRW